MDCLAHVTADAYQLYRTLASMLDRATIVRVSCPTGGEGIEVHDALYGHGYPVEAEVEPPVPIHAYVQRSLLADAVALRHPARMAVHPDRLVVNGVALAALVDASRISPGQGVPEAFLTALVPEPAPLPEEIPLPVALLEPEDAEEARPGPR